MIFRKPLIILLILFSGCASYYQKNLEFHNRFADGEIEQAAAILGKNRKAAKGKDRLLYFLQNGVVFQMLGEYQKSNKYFEDAYLFIQDFQKNHALEALSLISNPMVKPYRGEDFEIVLIHYYKALNFLRMGKFEEALVESRRIDIVINELNDKYSNHKNHYKRDAFSLNLTGIIYETTGDINNAFIAYRNAYEVYQTDYQEYFGLTAPLQLKKDLLRTAYLNGFYQELESYQEEFGFSYQEKDNNGGELIFFWNNGLGPVKSEWSINFAIVKGTGGVITFTNEDYDYSFPYQTGYYGEESKFSDLKVIRVAFPKYTPRESHLESAVLKTADNAVYQLELAQNINEIAIKTLEDRMLREFSTSLLRAAIKQTTEELVRKKSEGWGTLVSIVNAVTEKADTRNWQTLPYSISYARVPLKEGHNFVTLQADNGISEQFEFNINKGETVFQLFHSLE